MPANKNNNTIADYDALLAVAQVYVDGLKTGNVDLLKQTFHPDASWPVLCQMEN